MASKSTYFKNPWYLIKTGFLLLTWIVMAMHVELIGPTMTILAKRLQVDFSGIGSALAARGIGYLVANILGVILQKIVKKHSDGLLIIAFLLSAIVVFLTPHMGSLFVICGLFFIHGIGQGLIDLCGTNVLLAMWGTNAAAPLNIVQLGYGIGAIFVNLLIRPFVNSTRTNIVIPYSITASLCILMAIGFVFFYIQALKNSKEKLVVQQVDYAVVNTKNEEKCSSNSSRSFELILSILFISCIFFIIGNDQTFSKFFFTYLKSDKFHLSIETASWGIILYWLSYSIGRLIIAIISVFLSVSICLNILWFIALCLAITWLVFVWIIGLTGTNLFILGASTGLVFSPLIPLTFALFNKRLNVTPMLLALVFSGAAFGMIVFQKLAGFVMDWNPNQFPSLLVSCMLASISLYIISNVIYFVHQRKRTSITIESALEDLHEEEEEEEQIIIMT
ncbi:hypothetical protein I4U23_003672 [Adineta vaga]|nr:hypothetical protein I4U23_003672 [Adineta vaga]